MKKIFTYSILAAFVVILFTSCTKDRIYTDNSHWLSQERGNVVYSNNYCGYYVVETNYGYTVIQNLDGLRTYQSDVMYGDFGNYGNRNFYNYTADIVTLGDIVEYDLTYNQAQDAIDYYCPAGRANNLKIIQSPSTENKISRTAPPVKK
jgi:hypothetical protein